MNRRMRLVALALIGAGFAAGAGPARAFVTFETGQVRPMAKSPDGSRLFVCNTPDNRIEIFDIDGAGLTHVSSVPVGLEPVAVAARTNTEIWVVNFLSDSVSIVDVSDIDLPKVTRTLTVGDEPRDIVFGGPAFDKAFITAAHRGQNVPFDPQLTTPGVPRADVWVFDANNLGNTFGGDETTILHLFGDTPRPLAVSADGTRVYAGVFLSGNQTTVLNEGAVPNGGEPNGLPDPPTNHSGTARPEVGLIVKWDGTKWTDELDRDWSGSVMFSLPDYDVFAIDASANPPAKIDSKRFAHVGTTLFNMAINPADGKLFVSNLEAFNEVRFEGPGVYADTTVRGHLVESRITVIDPVNDTVVPRHLNKHIDYDSPFDPAPNDSNDKSLAFPLEMVFRSDGSSMYVAALGSSKVGVFVPSAIESDAFVPDPANHIEVTGGGPTGLVLDEANARLYVLTRFDNSVSVVNTTMNVETDHIALHNPEPASVVQGRPFLYDARLTSSRGDQACASCHIFGDLDALAWDLGNPDDDVLNNPSPIIVNLGPNRHFHPMKGPMTTQSLRGMDNHGPMHWRGDRTGGNDAANAQPDGGSFDEQAAFKKFNPAFVGLIGRSEQLTAPQMQSFTDFILQVMYPPNPVRRLDNKLAFDEGTAEGVFFDRTTDSLQTCNGCHVLDREGNPTEPRKGFFGSDGRSTFENETQFFKVAHLRNLYQKVGMFGMTSVLFLNPGDNGFKGDQVRGFGFLHDGSVDTVFRFLQATVFNPNPGGFGFPPNPGLISDNERRQMEKFVLMFDSNHRPIVGQQVSRSASSDLDADSRIGLLLERADAGECDVVAKAVVGGEQRGYVYVGDGSWISDRASEGLLSTGAVMGKAILAEQVTTYTAVPVGEGERIGIDRDLDGFADADEIEAGSDPASVDAPPCSTTQSSFVFRKGQVKDRNGKLLLSADVTLASAYEGDIVAVDLYDGDGTIFRGIVSGTSLLEKSPGSWQFKAIKGTTGITQVKVKALQTANSYRVSVRTSRAWAEGSADETTATTAVTLHVADECIDGPATKVD